MQKNPLPILDPNRSSSPAVQQAHRKNTSVATTAALSASSGSTANGQSVNGNGVDDSATDGTASASVPPAHPTATIAPAPGRSTASAAIEATTPCTGIDLGGIKLRTLAPSLFAFTNITTLYINHNHLTSLSPAISKLRALTLLDATGNQLTSVPPELGLLTSLKELLLFDNQLVDLPLELGTLHQLEFLGIEGNPLAEPLRIAMSEKGTQGLIAYFRDNAPVPPPPPPRRWEVVDEADEDVEDAEDRERIASETFSLLSYNVLAQRYATTQTYGYTPSWALEWSYRKDAILHDMTEPGTDIICLQEVDEETFNDFLKPRLEQLGYDGAHNPRTRARTMTSEEKRYVDGCATFWKRSKYTLIERQVIEFNQVALAKQDMRTDDMFNRVMSKDNIALVCLFENTETDARLVVANAHLHWDPRYRDVKLLQVAMLVEETDKIVSRFARLPPKHRAPRPGDPEDPNRPKASPTYSDATKIPLIICGDLNSIAHSSVYEFLERGKVAHDHADFMEYTYGAYTNQGAVHRMHLKNAYPLTGKGSLAFTNFTPGFVGTIDHIWYTGNSLRVTSLLGEVDKEYASKVAGFPNPHFPSDHIPVSAVFRPKRERPVMNGGSHR